MFFVGATGQILTLILTVSLPFIFLVSGHQKIDIHQPTLSFDILQNHQEISSFDFNSFEFEQDYSAIIDNKTIKIEDPGFIKIPHYNFRIKQKSFCLNDSGNKAPPTSIYFTC